MAATVGWGPHGKMRHAMISARRNRRGGRRAGGGGRGGGEDGGRGGDRGDLRQPFGTTSAAALATASLAIEHDTNCVGEHFYRRGEERRGSTFGRRANIRLPELDNARAPTGRGSARGLAGTASAFLSETEHSSLLYVLAIRST